MKNHRILFSALALSVFALAGCSSAEQTSLPSSSATTSPETSAQSSDGATPFESASSPAVPGATSRTAPGKSQPVATPAGGGSSVPTLASGKTVEFTDEELAKYRAGEYVAATEKHQAYNVPVPVMPEAAKEKTAEGAAAFVEYWTQATNYALMTGDTELAKNLTDSSWQMYFSLFTSLEDHYEEGKWVVGGDYKTTVDISTYKISEDGEASLIVQNYEAPGASYDKDLVKIEVLEEETYNYQPTRLYLKWESDGWQALASSGLVGVDYGK